MPQRLALSALWVLALLAGAARAADLADCDAAVPQPAPAQRPWAQAYWLDGRTVQ